MAHKANSLETIEIIQTDGVESSSMAKLNSITCKMIDCVEEVCKIKGTHMVLDLTGIPMVTSTFLGLVGSYTMNKDSNLLGISICNPSSGIINKLRQFNLLAEQDKNREEIFLQVFETIGKAIEQITLKHKMVEINKPNTGMSSNREM